MENGMQTTPVFLLGESHGQRTLQGFSPKGHKELDMTEWLSTCIIYLSSFTELELTYSPVVSKVMTWLAYIMKWLHFQIYHTAVWYMLTHNSNKNWSCSMSSFLVILIFLFLKPFLGDLVLRQESTHTHRAQWAAEAPYSLTSIHLPAQFTLGSSWCYPLKPSAWLNQATLCQQLIT